MRVRDDGTIEGVDVPVRALRARWRKKRERIEALDEEIARLQAKRAELVAECDELQGVVRESDEKAGREHRIPERRRGREEAERPRRVQ